MVEQCLCSLHELKGMQMTTNDRRHDDERLTEIEAKLDKLASDVQELVAAWKAANVIVGFIKWAGGIATGLTALIALLKLKG